MLTKHANLESSSASSSSVMSNETSENADNRISSTDISSSSMHPFKFHLRTFGCQMNVNDSDIVRALLLERGFTETLDETDADVLLTNTCAIREGAEQKVWHRLRELRGKFKSRKVVGVLGCMAERLQTDLFRDGLADLVVGPDAYRDLPRLMRDLLREPDDDDAELGRVNQAFNVQLSLDETYADVTPVRRHGNSVSAFVSIQRGCANRCSFCIVPFTRGQERSRPFASVVGEIQQLYEQGVKEVTLLGQNVNSYHDTSETALSVRPDSGYRMSNDGFRSRIRRHDGGYYFADLVAAVSDISSELRVRFTSPHPKDYPPPLLTLMAERPNVCNHLHMPAQSGSTSMLQRMKRGYSREAYLELMDTVHEIIPDVAISSDFIAGFCDESEEEHLDTLSLMERVRYDQAFMFAYSMRGKTHAHRTMQDNVPEDVKKRRLIEIIDTFQRHVQEKNESLEVGRLRLVLVEGESKRSHPGARAWQGRTDQNKRIIFPVDETVTVHDHAALAPVWTTLLRPHAKSERGFDPKVQLAELPRVSLSVGDYVVVQVTEAKGHTLRGKALWRSGVTAFDQIGLSGMDEASLGRAQGLQHWWSGQCQSKQEQRTGVRNLEVRMAVQ
jgi:MiaB/RimO family radical SAM methylthiotransferase